MMPNNTFPDKNILLYLIGPSPSRSVANSFDSGWLIIQLIIINQLFIAT